MRKFTLALLLTLIASEAFAASSAQMGHVFRRRIEICQAWGGCDEDGTGGGQVGAPSISLIANQRIAKNTSAGPISFTIDDDTTPPENLVVTVSAEDGMLLPQSGIVRSCSEENCTLTLTPANNETGQTDVTVGVNDGTQTTTRTFILRVLDGTTPFIGPIADQSVNVNHPIGPVAFIVDDLDTNLDLLVPDAISGDEALVHTDDISFGGMGEDRTISLQPQPDARGVAQITVTVADPDGNTGLRTFFVHIGTAPEISGIAPQQTQVDTPTAPIPFTVADDGGVDTLTVTGHAVNTTLVPDGNFTIDCTAGNCTVVIIPAPGQTGTTTIRITVDDGTEETFTEFTFEVIGGGPSQPPTITAIADQTIQKDTSTAPLPFTVGDDNTPLDDLTITTSVSEQASWYVILDNANIVLGGNGADWTLIATPNSGMNGVVHITVSVTDVDNQTSSTSFRLLVEGTAPWVDPIPTQTTLINTPIDVPVRVGDDGGAENLTMYYWWNDGPQLVDDANMSFSGSGEDRILHIVPNTDAAGTMQIGVEAADANWEWADTLFDLRVMSTAPLISDISNQSVLVNITVGPLDFQITDDTTPPDSLILTATSGDESIIPNDAEHVILGGSGENRTITLVPLEDMSGSLDLTLTVSDGLEETSKIFRVTVFDPAICSAVLHVDDVVADPQCGEGCESIYVPFTLDDPMGYSPDMTDPGDVRWLSDGTYVRMEVPSFLSSWYQLEDDRTLELNPNESSGFGGVVPGEADVTLTYGNGWCETSDTFHLKVGHVIPPSDICNIQFENLTDVEPNTYVDSYPVLVDGFTGPRTITVTGSKVQGVSYGDAPFWLWNYAPPGTPFEINPGQYMSVSMRSTGRMGESVVATVDAGEDCTSTFTVTTKPDDPSIPDEYPPFVECTPSGWQDIFINDPCDLVCTFYDNRTPVGSLIKDVGMSWGSTNLVTSLGSCSGDTCAVNCRATNNPSGGYVEVSAVDDAGNVGMVQNGYINVMYDKNKLKGHIYVYGYSQGYYYMGSWRNLSWQYWTETNVITDEWVAYNLTGNSYGPEFALISPDLQAYMINDIAPTVTALDIGGDDIGAGGPTVTKISSTRFYHLDIPLTDVRTTTGTRNYNIQVTDGSGLNRITITNPANSIPFFLSSGTQNGWGYQRNDDLVWCDDPAPDTSTYAEWREDGVVANGGWLQVRGTRQAIEGTASPLDASHVSGMASNPMCLEVKGLNTSVSPIPVNTNYYFKRFHVNRLLMPPNPPEPSITCTATNTATGDTFPITATLQSTPVPTTCRDDCDYVGYSHACLADCGPGYPSACRQDCPSDASDPAQRPYVLLRQYVPYCLLDCAPQILYYSGEVNQLLPGKSDGLHPLDMTGNLSVSCPSVIANYRFNSVEQDILMFEAEVYPYSAQAAGFPVRFCNGAYGVAPFFANPQPTGSFPVSKVLTP